MSRRLEFVKYLWPIKTKKERNEQNEKTVNGTKQKIALKNI